MEGKWLCIHPAHSHLVEHSVMYVSRHTSWRDAGVARREHRPLHEGDERNVSRPVQRKAAHCNGGLLLVVYSACVQGWSKSTEDESREIKAK